MQPPGPAAEFPPTDFQRDDAIALELRLEAQCEWGFDVELAITNVCNHRLLLPELFLTDLKLGHLPSVRLAEWSSDCLISSVGGESVLEPGERRSLHWLVRSTQWTNELALAASGMISRPVTHQPEELRDWDDQGRVAVDLPPGEYLMWYELTVDERYFNLRSHARLNDLRRLATEKGALVWIGTAKSNRIPLLHGGKSHSSSARLAADSPHPSGN
ncbi:MAG TPA: hypothetical protein VM452_10565 [Caulifigura sp.]|nr:hypothetical protein [Caulifigura sp.]